MAADMMRGFGLLFVVGILCVLGATADSSTSKSKTPKKINIAFCLTGQLARLELLSKVQNIFIANANAGHNVNVYILLDNEVEDIKQTFWKYDYTDNPFLHYDEKKMKSYIDKKVDAAGLSDKININVRLSEPSQDHFQVVGKKIPVADKIIKNPNSKMGAEMPKDGIEPAAVRFQNNMRWMAGLRDCVRWVQDDEYNRREFHDLVVRLRDDTLAFGKWILSYEKYNDALTSARTGSFRGINDHNFVIDRKWADSVFRGFTEDYYFNKTLADQEWGNPEHRIFMLAEANNVPIQTTTVCEQPLMPLRGKHNSTHWLLHASYASKFQEECNDPKTKDEDKCYCDSKWLRMFKTGYVSLDLQI